MTTDEAELAAAVRRLRHHGIAAGQPTDIAAPGFNYRLPDVLCALGIPQLERLESLLEARERVAGWYEERLEHLVGDAVGATRATGTAGRRTSSRSTGATRRSPALRAEGIEAQIGTYAVHRLSAYRDRGLVPGRGRGVRAGARASLRGDDDRGRGRPGQRRPWLATPEPWSSAARDRSRPAPARSSRPKAGFAGREASQCSTGHCAEEGGSWGNMVSPTLKGRCRPGARARASAGGRSPSRMAERIAAVETTVGGSPTPLTP